MLWDCSFPAKAHMSVLLPEPESPVNPIAAPSGENIIDEITNFLSATYPIDGISSIERI